ncbi:MAG TPA: Stp1/IreP family PP2C-type Ser/Thr phosphatase, partial [Thermoleophilaceae bacterium]|nr:Stp1/IreP family PP2C-type Ser/Thr phosphatase [Thermoleophilaceae bacterium]
MSLRIVEQVALSDVGRQRSSNEDSYFQGSPLFAVADGMGGAQAGEVASSIAVKTVGELMEGSWDTPEGRLVEIATEANRRIHELSQRDSSRQGMGCTLTVAFVGDGEVTIGHVGDSRAYRLRDGSFEQLTNDHSLVEELVRQGKLTAEEAEVHPQRSIITRALGPEGEVEVDAFTHAAKPGDLYLLCSDGLTGMVPDERICEILGGDSPLSEAASTLIGAANDNGGRDNITVVLFRLGSGEDGEGDDLGGTQVDLTADQVRDAAAMTKPADVQETVPRDTQKTAPRETVTSATAVTGGAAAAEREVDDFTRVGTPTLEAPPPEP